MLRTNQHYPCSVSPGYPCFAVYHNMIEAALVHLEYRAIKEGRRMLVMGNIIAYIRLFRGPRPGHTLHLTLQRHDRDRVGTQMPPWSQVHQQSVFVCSLFTFLSHAESSSLLRFRLL